MTMRTIEANGVRSSFDVSGHGPALLLVHGGEADHGMFADLASALGSWFQVFAYDQRDSGSTVDLHPDGPRAYQLADLADDAAALVEALGFERMHVFGTSLGGHIAQVLAARHPARLDHLVLSSTWAAGASLSSISPERAAELAAWRQDIAANAGRMAALFHPPDVLASRPALVDLFRVQRRTQAQRARRGALLGAPCGLMRIGAPTLLLAGACDRLVPAEHTLALAHGIDSCRAEVLPGVGHIGCIQAPRQVAQAVIEFIAGASQRSRLAHRPGRQP